MKMKQTHPIACSIPKVVTVRKSNGKKEKVVAYPTFLFEVVEKLKANQIQIN